MAYQDLERDMMINKLIEDEKHQSISDEKQKIVESMRRNQKEREAMNQMDPLSGSEEVRASFSLKDEDILRIDKRINATMMDLVRKTLHILVEVEEDYLQTINKD